MVLTKTKTAGLIIWLLMIITFLPAHCQFIKQERQHHDHIIDGFYGLHHPMMMIQYNLLNKKISNYLDKKIERKLYFELVPKLWSQLSDKKESVKNKYFAYKTLLVLSYPKLLKIESNQDMIVKMVGDKQAYHYFDKLKKTNQQLLFLTAQNSNLLNQTRLQLLAKTLSQRIMFNIDLSQPYNKQVRTKLLNTANFESWLVNGNYSKPPKLVNLSKQDKKLLSHNLDTLYYHNYLNFVLKKLIKTHNLNNINHYLQILSEHYPIPEKLIRNHDYQSHVDNLNDFIEHKSLSYSPSQWQALALNTINGDANPINQFDSWLRQSLKPVANLQLREALYQSLSWPIKTNWRKILAYTMINLNQIWQHQVYPYYGKDFSSYKQFFDPKIGVLKQYLKTNLYVFNHHNYLGVHLSFNNQFVNFLQQSKLLSNNFYYSYEIAPIPSANIVHVELNLGENYFSYDNGPERWQHYVWDSNHPPNETVLSVIFKNHQRAVLHISGPWGLQQLLQKAKIKKISSHKIKATWYFQKYRTHVSLFFQTDTNTDIDLVTGEIIKNLMIPSQLN